jgi:hypothetical protein
MLKELLAALGPGNWLGMKPQIDPGKTPIELDYRTDPFEIKLRLILGTLVIALAGAGWWLVGREETIVTVVAAGFSLFALANMMIGISKIGYKKKFYLTSTSANVTTTSLLGTRKWTEQLAAYDGIMLRSEQFRNDGPGNMNSTRNYHIVELYHSNAARRLPLWVNNQMGPARAAQEAFAKRLKLAAIAPDAEGITARDAKSLDQSVGERAAALARKRVQAIDPGPAPRGVMVAQDGAETVITLQNATGSWWLTLVCILVGFGGVGIILYNFLPPDELLLVGGALLAMVGTMGLISWGCFKLLQAIGLLSRKKRKLTELRMGPNGIRVIHDGIDMPSIFKAAIGRMGGEALIQEAENPAQHHLALADIEQVRVEKYISRTSTSDMSRARLVHGHILYIESDKFRLQFGNASSRKLIWVRDFVLYQLSAIEPSA